MEVVDGVTWTLALLAHLVLGLCVHEVLTESIPVCCLGGGLYFDGSEVIGKLVNNVLDALAQLKLVEGADALVGNSHSDPWSAVRDSNSEN